MDRTYNECALEFMQEAVNEGGDEALLRARRFAYEHDTVEFASTKEVFVQCRLANCAIRLCNSTGTTEVTGACQRLNTLTK